ncbi:MAG: hypothetical protein Q9184_001687 [Pyrenodesmia sp. 2 TL-2023]
MARPSEPSSKGTEGQSDRQAELETLVAQATSKYALKDYDAAAEFYSEATEIQAEINGEMSPKNANLLYAYGRCLYHAAVRNSDVLGSKVAGEKQQAGSEKSPKQNGKRTEIVGTGMTDGTPAIREEGAAQTTGDFGALSRSEAAQDKAGKPYFQFTGDENFEESEEEADAQQPDGESGETAEEEDDFANAFEVLDLARVLLLKRLEEEEQGEVQTKSRGDPNDVEPIRQLKERLADTHDLQAEISLEGERFPNAVDDLRTALELKKELFPEESSLIAEAHYKLSLALEFSSVTEQKAPDGEGHTKAETHVDEAMREESAQEMEAAIASCKSRISKEEARLHARKTGSVDQTKETLGSGKNMTRKDIDDVKEMVVDMEQRLIELRQSPISIDNSASGGNGDGSVPLGGILGSMLGESPAAQREKLSEASKGATDLSNLVKRKKPSANPASEEVGDDTAAKSGGKRKVDFVEEVVEVGTGKKAKLLDGNEEEV